MVQIRNLVFRTSIVVTLLLTGLILFSPLARSQSYLYNRSDFGTGNNPAAVILADFNGDGRLDFAVANSGSNTVSILLGRPDGTFAQKSDYPTGNLPQALVAADFNGDRKLDLAVLDAQGNAVSVLLGNGDGSFQMKIDYSVGTFPVGIVAADFNGDKKVDLAVVNQNDSTVSMLLGNGDGSFQGQATVPVGTTPTSIASGDFNGDHKTDLITSNIGTGTVTVLLSNGNGSFTRIDSPSGIFSAPNTSTLAVGDFNKDGKTDVIVSDQSSQQLLVLLGKGNGGFQPPTSIPNPSGLSIGPMVVADFNHDGKLDIASGTRIASGGISVFLGNGNGTFQQPVVSFMGGSTTSLAAADFNRDGNLDIAMTNPNLESVDVLLGNGKGIFGAMKTVSVASPSSGPDWAVVGDFNGDGKADLAVAEINFPNGQVSVELGKGNGTFQPPIVSPLNTSAVNANFMATGDFNGDGKIDLLVSDSYERSFEVLLGNGNGTFQPPVVTTVSCVEIVTGDFNGDGKTDLAITVPAMINPPFQIYISNGDGTFSPGAQYPHTGRMLVADVDHDGKMDVVLYGFGSPLQVLLGNGNGTFKSLIAGPRDNFSTDMVFGDFNGDGKLDLVAGTYNGVAFLAGNGDGTFQTPVHSDTAVGGFSGRLVAGDFSGNGKLGLVANPPFSTTLSGTVVMAGNGDGTFQAPISYGVGGVFSDPIVAADFNSDGISDFALPGIGGPSGTLVSLYSSLPAPNLSTAKLSFGGQLLGTTSKALIATLTNVGNSPLSVSGISVTGDYKLTQSCGSRVPIGASCTLDVTFTPTQLGTRTGSITIKDNAAASPQVIHLTGVGK